MVMKAARLFDYASMTIELQICDVAPEPLSDCMTAVLSADMSELPNGLDECVRSRARE